MSPGGSPGANPGEDSPRGGLGAVLRDQATLVSLPEHAGDILGTLVRAAGDHIMAVYLFGSRLSGSAPRKDSVLDLAVVVHEYAGFYHDLRQAGVIRGPARPLALLNRTLAPNVIHVVGTADAGGGAKLLVISESDLALSLDRWARDHFMLGRLCQRVALVHAPDEVERVRAMGYLVLAVRRTLDWAAPYVPGSFTIEEFCRGMLAVSYGGEIRPESPHRVEEVYDAQAEFFQRVYGALFLDEEARGRLSREGERWRYARPPNAEETARRTDYFRRSRRRATLRWAKYVVTFEGWLDYIASKLERRTGMRIRLTALERALPLIFLWPRAIRVVSALRREQRRVRP